MILTWEYTYVRSSRNHPNRFRYSSSTDNCGTGAGGFQKGNTCGRGKGSGKETHPGQKKERRDHQEHRERIYHGTQVSRQDKMAAAATPKIPHPQSDEDVKRFVSSVEKTPVYRA